MYTKIIALAAVAFSAVPAFAADAVVQDPAYVQQGQTQSAFDWSGFYLGLQGGYTSTHASYLNGSEQDLDGGSTGIYGGYNFQHGPFIFGIENDFNYNWKDGSDVSLKWDGSARGRVGYALDRTLIYGTGGLAAAGGEVDVPGIGKKDDILIGWTAGGGVERALTDNIMMRAEYRYDDFGRKDFGSALGDFEVNQQKVTIGTSFKF
ncbi:porin family protein [Rhizobium leguminosarum]|jgi:outer membrane immunogenic protein|uniref:Porin family protein n=2 Tax=Rhizobium TaxID=379 RepID=A0A444IDS7_RHILE|nr:MULTISPECIES: outer membrane protein [Rhizobium]NKL64265.1 outer membrane beta-barrel protein [Rhizobium leguminosarum bv. viciae]RWX09327.1 porin family protein [Rhizobium leguminosarum]RWX37457.1 porin family protein [Rhizobium leguminosarum]TBC60899.1 porin family protein [Rhizobium leguminosarum]TBC87433.1 porin family protein [Rhizobium leguminosarum]